VPTALYFPHPTLNDKAPLTNVLLLWDAVECITPTSGKRSHFFGEPDWDEAREMLLRDRIPSDTERRTVHGEVAAILRESPSTWSWRLQKVPGFEPGYPIDAGKSNHET
jgi:hypothetical protein